MVTLNELLNEGHEFDCELITGSWETPYSFAWNETTRTTLEAGEHFKKVLSSPVLIRNGNLLLTNEDITEEELTEFTSAGAGYCSSEDYAKWFKEVE